MDPQARGAFLGLTLRHRRAHLVRAIMEGVVFALRQGLELMISLGGHGECIVASGGATNHPLWLQLQADIFNRPIARTETVEGGRGRRGAAGVAWGLASTRIYSLPAGRWYISKRMLSNPIRRAEFYDQAYSEFCSLYPKLNVKRNGDYYILRFTHYNEGLL